MHEPTTPPAHRRPAAVESAHAAANGEARATPAGAKWTVTTSDAEAIATDFGMRLLGEPVTVWGGVNGVARITTDRGRFVTRVHRPWTSVERLEGVHRVQRHLAAAGLPVPEPIACPNGRRWTRLDDRLVELLPDVGVGHEASSWEEFRVSAALLGTLHAALDTWRGALPPPEYASFATPAAALARLADSEAAFAALREHPEFERALAVRREVTTIQQRLRESRAALEASPPQRTIHGDFVGRNVLFERGAVFAILDFDRMARRDRVHDIAVTLECALGRMEFLQGAQDDDLQQVAALAHAYDAAAPARLEPVERALLPYEMARVPLYPVIAAGAFARRGDAETSIAETLSVERALPRVRWMLDHAHELADAVRG